MTMGAHLDADCRGPDHGTERVLVLVRYSGRGKTSELDLGRLRSEAAHVFCFRGSKVAGIVVYFDRQRALADLGLKE